MKALLINGSPHAHGNTARALDEVASALKADGLETEIAHIGVKPVRGCVACRKCFELGRCVFSDDVANEILEKALAADALVLGSPVYYAQPNGALLAVMQRVFYAANGRRHSLPARRRERGVPDAQHVLRHPRNARRGVAILEHRLRRRAGRSRPRRGRPADDAPPRTQPRVDGEEPRHGHPRPRTAVGKDELRSVKVKGTRRARTRA